MSDLTLGDGAPLSTASGQSITLDASGAILPALPAASRVFVIPVAAALGVPLAWRYPMLLFAGDIDDFGVDFAALIDPGSTIVSGAVSVPDGGAIVSGQGAIGSVVVAFLTALATGAHDAVFTVAWTDGAGFLHKRSFPIQLTVSPP